MLPFRAHKPLIPPAGGLTGWDTPILVANDPATATTRNYTVSGVTAGQRVFLILTSCSDGTGVTPTAFVIALGGTAASHVIGPGPTTSHAFAAVFSVVAPSSGDLALAIDTVNPTRSMTVHAIIPSGHNAGAPVAQSAPSNFFGSNATSRTTPSGVSTLADGNAVIGILAVTGGNTTSRAVTGADGFVFGQPGADQYNDHTWGIAWKRTPTVAAVTLTWSWTESRRGSAIWFEIAKA